MKVRPSAAETPRPRRADGLNDGLALSISGPMEPVATNWRRLNIPICLVKIIKLVEVIEKPVLQHEPRMARLPSDMRVGHGGRVPGSNCETTAPCEATSPASRRFSGG